MELSEKAKKMLDEKKTEDTANNKMELLFPFFEKVLGYDVNTPGEVSTAPAYTKDGKYKIDYALSEPSDEISKCFVKVLPFNSDLDGEADRVASCIAVSDSAAKFVIITDCFKYNIYAYDLNEMKLISAGSFDITDLDNIDPTIIDLIKKTGPSKPKQEYAVRDEDLPESPGISDNQYPEIPQFPIKDNSDNKKKKNKKIFIITGIIILIAAAITAMLLLNRDPDGNANIPFINTQNSINKKSLEGSLDVSLSNDLSTMNISLKSDGIPAGSIIKFNIVNGSVADYAYTAMKSGGIAQLSYDIPSSWNNSKTTVTASLRFDEADHSQPNSVKEKFGANGENIIAKEGAKDKFIIDTKSITYSSDSVNEQNNQDAIDSENEKREKIRKDWSSVEARADTLGNWKVIPKNFDMNTVNITEARNVYPQIFYNAKEKQTYFYLVCGTINQLQMIRFTNVLFYADGYQWSYDLNTNEHKVDVTGGAAKEWVYFHNFNIPTLLSDVKLLAESDMSKLTFKGDKIKEHQLSESEKKDISNMLYIYDTYFKNGEEPQKEWLEIAQNESGDSMSLSYVKTPSQINERDKAEEDNISALLSDIQNKRDNGTSVPASTESNLNDLTGKYKKMPENIKSEIIKAIKTEPVHQVNNFNLFDSGDNYYKFYFKYDVSNTTIETGYIPYIYITDSGKTYIPIKTNNSGVITQYCTFTLDSSLLDKIKSSVKSTSYSVVK